MKKFHLKMLLNGLLMTCLFAAPASANDDVTEMQVVVSPASAKIRPFETAVIQIRFFGQKKKGLLGTLLGVGNDEKQRVESSDWKISLKKQGNGWLSKPFLFQEKDERTKSGLENLIKQSLGSISAEDSVLYTAPGKTGKFQISINNNNLSEQITIEVIGSAPTSKTKESVNFPSGETSSDPYFALAEHYAPFIAQETWFTPRADFLTRFDYDGNWKGDDNWENLGTGSSQAFVYYAAMETETHWFLIYNFYHPRDYSDVCIAGTCHENDSEGVILTVRKDRSRFGRLEVLETLAHNNVYSFTNNARIKKGIHNIDGRIDLYQKTHPIIFIEAGGHGVYAGGYRSSLFSTKTMDFKDNTGITYVYKREANRPVHPNDRNIGYALLPIFDEWWIKGNQESAEPNETFEDFYIYEPFGGRPKTKSAYISGSFRGRTASDNMAKPFWAWHDRRSRDKKLLNTGQWGLDPAYAVSVSLSFPADLPVSTRYVFNPFLETASENTKSASK